LDPCDRESGAEVVGLLRVLEEGIVRTVTRPSRSMAPSGIASDRRFEAIACGRVLEGVEAELVRERRQRNLRVVRHSLPQRQRPVRGQLAHQPVGQWLEGIVVVLFRVCLAADRDDGALAGVRAMSGGAVRGAGAALDGKEDSDTAMEGIRAGGWGGRMRKES